MADKNIEVTKKDTPKSKKEAKKIETALQKGFRKAGLAGVLNDPSVDIQEIKKGYCVTLKSKVYNFNTTSKSFF